MDKYIVTALDRYICYFKNGKLHREDGPAAYFREDQHKYINIKDKNLYKTGFPNNNRLEMMILVCDLTLNGSVSYYLEGEHYEKEEFDRIIENEKQEKN